MHSKMQVGNVSSIQYIAYNIYRKISNLSSALVRNKIIDHSDVDLRLYTC